VLAVLRREIRGRQAASKAVAVIADPVFEADDPRVATASPRPHPVAAPAPASDLRRALRDVGMLREGGLSVPRLLSSRQEADAIIAAAAGAGISATDFAASRATATSPELGQYRIVHFATHGLLNSEHPELSGLVLSLVNEQGKDQDGFLRLHDIYNLNLPVDLVVLSACNTGLGKEVRGEGLVGIVRGFMYAGAARVVSSLWKVDDEATAELMKRFYQQMLQGGLTPAAALRAAQVDMWQQKRWRSPYYWAAFGLQGEWK
jgi:CHAT domain-containing protein